MDQVEIEITSLAITARYGALAEGSIVRTDAAFAHHLVKEAFCAKYTNAADADVVIEVQSAAPAAPARATRGPRGAKPQAPVDAAAPATDSTVAGAADATEGDATGAAVAEPAVDASAEQPETPPAA